MSANEDRPRGGFTRGVDGYSRRALLERRSHVRRLVILGLAGLVVLSLAMPATAKHATFEKSGSARVGHPLVGFTGGFTENAAACDPAAAENGIDGVWYDITGFGAHTATLTVDANSDFDVYWYDDTCTWIDDSGMAQGFVGETETAPVPGNAKWVIVDYFFGANGTFTLKIA
jgi:hypothetical protein